MCLGEQNITSHHRISHKSSLLDKCKIQIQLIAGHKFRVDQKEAAGGGRHLVPDSKTLGLALLCLLLDDILDVGSPLLPVVEAVNLNSMNLGWGSFVKFQKRFFSVQGNIKNSKKSKDHCRGVQLGSLYGHKAGRCP